MPESTIAFEIVLERRPMSLQTKNRASLSHWKSYVTAQATAAWSTPPFAPVSLHLTLIYFFDHDPIDVDNIVKPIQDALVGVVYSDDDCVTDVDSHRRKVGTPVDLKMCSERLSKAVLSGDPFVYVRVLPAKELEAYL